MYFLWAYEILLSKNLVIRWMVGLTGVGGTRLYIAQGNRVMLGWPCPQLSISYVFFLKCQPFHKRKKPNKWCKLPRKIHPCIKKMFVSKTRLLFLFVLSLILQRPNRSLSVPGGLFFFFSPAHAVILLPSRNKKKTMQFNRP